MSRATSSLFALFALLVVVLPYAYASTRIAFYVESGAIKQVRQTGGVGAGWSAPIVVPTIVTLNANTKLAVASFSVSGTPHVVLFYQDLANDIVQVTSTTGGSTWAAPVTVIPAPTAISGTALAVAVTTFSATTGNLYFQDGNDDIRQATLSGATWTVTSVATFVYAAKPLTPLSAVALAATNDLRVYFLDASNNVIQYQSFYGGPWSGGSIWTTNAASLAAVFLPASGNVNLYFANVGGNVVYSLTYSYPYWNLFGAPSVYTVSPSPIPGGLAAVSDVAYTYLNLQDGSDKLFEVYLSPGYSDYGFLAQSVAGASAIATTLF